VYRLVHVQLAIHLNIPLGVCGSIIAFIIHGDVIIKYSGKKILLAIIDVSFRISPALFAIDTGN
jgi:ABC-type sulfate transport system permease subunit